MLVIENNQAVATVPFNERFIAFARSRKAQWSKSKKKWEFDLRDLDQINQTIQEIYGNTENDKELVDVKITVTSEFTLYQEGFEIVGRYLIHDEGWKQAPNVIVIKGKTRLGGSRKNWNLTFPTGMTFELRDLPRSAANLAITQTNNEFTIEEIRSRLVAHPNTSPYANMTRAELQKELFKAQKLVLDIQKALDAQPPRKKKKSMMFAP